MLLSEDLLASGNVIFQAGAGPWSRFSGMTVSPSADVSVLWVGRRHQRVDERMTLDTLVKLLTVSEVTLSDTNREGENDKV